MNNKSTKSIRLVNLKMVRERSLQYEESVSRADDIIKMVKPIFENTYRETVVVVGLDSASRPTVLHTVGTGSPNQSPVFVANVFKPLLLSNSISFILIHNHPAGTLIPSGTDRDITNKVKAAGKLLEINMLDHIILNADCSEHYSFNKSGML